MSSSPLSFKDQAYLLFACQSLGDRKTPLPVVSQVFAPSLSPQPSPLPLFPSLPFIPGTIVWASSFGPLHIPSPNQKPFLTPPTRPAVVLSGMWHPPRVGWGARMLPIYIPACQLQEEQGQGVGGGLKEQGVQSHQTSREERKGEGRTMSSRVSGQGSEASPGAQRILGQAKAWPFTPLPPTYQAHCVDFGFYSVFYLVIIIF